MSFLSGQMLDKNYYVKNVTYILNLVSSGFRHVSSQILVLGMYSHVLLLRLERDTSMLTFL